MERLGATRRSRLTPRGRKLGVLLVKRHTRLLGLLVSLAGSDQPPRLNRHPTAVEAAFRQVDAVRAHLGGARRLQPAASATSALPRRKHLARPSKGDVAPGAPA